MRLINNNETAQTAEVMLMGKSYSFEFGKYEVKTLVFDGEKLIEKEFWL